MKQYYSISDLANEFNISTRTIRYYEEMELLKPERDQNTQYRKYSRANRARLILILRGKRFGFSLDEIKEMIELFDNDRTGVKQLQKTIEYGNKKIEEIENRINELFELKNEITTFRDQFIEKLNNQKNNPE